MRGRQRHLMNSSKSLGASLHIDARDTNVAEDATIAELACRAGTGNFAENAANASGSRPILKKTQLNGVPSAKFDGSVDFLGIRNGFSARCIIFVCTLDSDVFHGIIGDFLTGGGPSNMACAYTGGGYAYAKFGAFAGGDYVFADRTFRNNTESSSGSNAATVNVFDRNSRSAYTYGGSYAVRIGTQAFSFVFSMDY